MVKVWLTSDNDSLGSSLDSSWYESSIEILVGDKDAVESLGPDQGNSAMI